MCAVEETGKNSVRPSTIARIMASIILMKIYYLFFFGASVSLFSAEIEEEVELLPRFIIA
jgi:hypothetical protein